jgi:hypothetical protein
MIKNAVMKLGALALAQESKKGFPQGIPAIAQPYMEANEIAEEDLIPKQEVPQQRMPEDQMSQGEEGVGPGQEMPMNMPNGEPVAMPEEMEEAENISPFTEATCNMTEAGESCPQHGMMECGMEEATALQGQYGHSGRMKPVDKDTSFLDRLKELSGMMRK